MPIDHLLSVTTEDKDDNEGSMNEWVVDHFERLQTAFKLAEDNTTRKAEKRQARHNRLVDATELPIGRHVLVRDRSVRGRNKIQDNWLPDLYQVTERIDPTGNVYTVEPLSGHGATKTVNRVELLDMKTDVMEDDEVETRHVPDEETDESTVSSEENESNVSSEDEDDEYELIMRAAEPVQKNEEEMETVIQQNLPEVAAEDEYVTVEDKILPPKEEETKEPRRSTRKGRGCHSNPHALPRSTVNNSVNTVPVPDPVSVNSQILADASRAQMLFMQVLSGTH